ncbi:MAG: class I SAM-dependent DNA methyltransferase [Bacteroidia bacterium]
MDKYQTTFETWNKLAKPYNEKFAGIDLYDDTYDFFLASIKINSASVLEVGCGPGNITKYLLSKRPDLKITATDVAPNMISLAKEINPSANCVVLDCRNLDSLREKFDGFVCGFCIPYLSKEDCEKLIRDFSGLSNPGAVIYLSAIEGDYDDSGFETSSGGDKCYVYYHSEDFLRQMFEKNGFSIKNVSRKSFSQSAHKSNTHLIILAGK